MDPLDLALKRLGRAVDRLETAVDLREQRVEKERTSLNQALQAARSDQAHTSSAAEAVSVRLEAAIDRLNTVLER
jgi:ribosomal protein S21